ncbi:MAG: hypothetical protein JST80_12300 [Bdellovibrionales bacterium]|nr:hypothetical protein [Bdellovibrionales bacterium]
MKKPRFFKILFSAVVVFVVVLGCGKPVGVATTATSNSGSTYRETGWDQPAVRIIFHADNFTDLNDFATGKHTAFQCLGDATRVFRADGGDYSSSPTAFDAANVADDFSVTNHPAFLKSVSVDITNSYYAVTQNNIVQTDRCSYRGIGGAPDPSSCADFDRMPAVAPTPTIAPTATPSPTPIPTSTPTTTQYYNTNYYRVRDDWCTGQGPILSPDPETTKSYVGGVSIDIDRNELGAYEDLLMIVTYHALSANSAAATNYPGTQKASDNTVMKVSLVGTGLDLATLLQVKQPRTWTYYQNINYPVYWREIASLEDPMGSLRSEEVYVPLSKNGLVDRIRIDRVRGSFHLYQVDLYRLGNRTE